MPQHPALERLIDEKISNTHAPQWELPIEEVRSAFRNLWALPLAGVLGLVAVISRYGTPNPSANPEAAARAASSSGLVKPQPTFGIVLGAALFILGCTLISLDVFRGSSRRRRRL